MTGRHLKNIILNLPFINFSAPGKLNLKIDLPQRFQEHEVTSQPHCICLYTYTRKKPPSRRFNTIVITNLMVHTLFLVN